MVHIGSQKEKRRDTSKSQERERDISEIESEGESGKRKPINTLRKAKEKKEYNIFPQIENKEIEPEGVFSEDEPKMYNSIYINI